MVTKLAGILASIATLSMPAIANADPPPWENPHYPNANMGHCPGGLGGFGVTWCDGARYPDGSYWHQIDTRTPECVIDNGSPFPPPAPPGGCDGTA
jgi:hypothetical protein